MADLILRNVGPMGGPAVDVPARDGAIARLGPGLEAAPGATVIDRDHGIAPPALVDTHMPCGDAAMLERAMLIACRNGFRDRADIVVLPGETLGELVAMRPPRARVIGGGRVIAGNGRCVL